MLYIRRPKTFTSLLFKADIYVCKVQLSINEKIFCSNRLSDFVNQSSKINEVIHVLLLAGELSSFLKRRGFVLLPVTDVSARPPPMFAQSKIIILSFDVLLHLIKYMYLPR